MQAAENNGEPGAPDSVAKNALLTLVLKLTGALFTGILTIVVVRKLGPTDYGVFGLALSIGAIAVLVADFGIAQSAGRSVAEAREEPGELDSVLAASLRLKLLASALICAALAASAGLIADAYNIPDLAWPLRVMAIAVFGQSFTSLWFTVYEGAGRVSLALRVAFGESVVETGSTVALVLLGTGAVGAATGRAVGYTFAAVLGFVIAGRMLGWRFRGDHRAHLRRIAGYAASLLVIDSAMVLFASIDVLLISAYLGASATGVFQAPLQLLNFAPFLGLALVGGIGPGLVDSLRDRQAIERLMSSLRLLVIVQAVVLAPAIIWATPITDLLFGPHYQGSAAVLRGFAPSFFMFGITAMLAISVNYMGEARRRVPIAIITVGINIVIDIVLIPRIGIVAGAVGTGVASAFYLVAHFVVLERTVRIDLGPLIITGARSLAAAAAMAGVLALAGTHSLSLAEWVLGGALGLFAYVATLLITRELQMVELQEIGSQVGARLRRGGAPA